MPPNTNRGPTVAGSWIRLGRRKPAGGSCRDEVAAALRTLRARMSIDVLTVREVYAEMVAAGTRYAESTVFKTMQRMTATGAATSLRDSGESRPRRVPAGRGSEASAGRRSFDDAESALG
jgi:hypothetical protein